MVSLPPINVYAFLNQGETSVPRDVTFKISTPGTQEELIDLDFKMMSITGKKLEWTKRCDMCEQKVSFAANTTFKCKKCGFVNDICAECQATRMELFEQNELKNRIEEMREHTIDKCFEGVGCQDP